MSQVPDYVTHDSQEALKANPPPNVVDRSALNPRFARVRLVVEGGGEYEGVALVQRQSHRDADEILACQGCGHSAAGGPWPGRSSGERPCFFCIRNVEREEWVKKELEDEGVASVREYFEKKTREAEARPDHPRKNGKVVLYHPLLGRWYDGSPAAKIPMDCYQPVDMAMQENLNHGGSEDDTLLG